jgi:hypothetical protein
MNECTNGSTLDSTRTRLALAGFRWARLAVMCQKRKNQGAGGRSADSNGELRCRVYVSRISSVCSWAGEDGGEVATQRMAAGPLGDLPGLTYDPVKNRYFPTREEDVKPKEEPRRGLKQRLERRGTADVGNGERKSKGKKERRRKEVVVEDEPERKEKCPRIDRTLLRATGLQLGYDRFSGPTSAEAQRRMR